MNLQENILRIKEMMGIINEEVITNQPVEIFSDGGGSEYADKYIGPVQKIPVIDTLPNEPFKDTSYMETSDNIKNMIQSINDGEQLPPIKVIKHPYDNSKYLVVDGNHRRYAFLKSDVNDVDAIVIPHSDVVLMKSSWGDNNKDYIRLSDVLDNKKLIDKYFVKPNGTNNFEQLTFVDEQEEMKEGELTERCWKGYTQKGMKTMFGKRYPNCVKKESVNESVKDGEITCDNCGWKWRLADGGKDMYICHECGSDNTPSDLPQINKEISLGKKLIVFKYWDRKGVKVDKLIQNFSQLNFSDLRRLVVEYYGGIELFNKHLEKEFEGKVFTCEDCNWGDLTFKFKVISATLDIDSDTGYIEGIYFATETLSGVYEDESGKKYSVVKVLDEYDHDLQEQLSEAVTENTKEYLEENFTYPQYGMGVTYVEMY